jgi:hypothetical protein
MGGPGEHAELLDVRGFGLAATLREGFEQEEYVAEGTKATKPFFHVHFRSPTRGDEEQEIAPKVAEERRQGSRKMPP